jgi:transcriptional regulator with XRE-family HTH domain
MAVLPPIAIPQPVKSVVVIRRISQLQIARATGATSNYVNRVFNGMVPPRAEFAAAVAAFLSMPESKLFRRERAPVSPLAGTRRSRR